MNIIFFVENNRAGGVDTFLINLINAWPSNSDNITLLCNNSHPGIVFIKKALQRKINFKTHKIPISHNIVDRYLSKLPISLKKICGQLIRLFLAYYQYRRLKKIFKMIDADYLMVINGSYPGGETSRLANIAWSNAGKKKSIHNFHNLAVQPRILTSIYENYIDKLMLGSVSSIVGVSKACSESIKIRKTFINYKRILTIYNGIPLPDRNETHTFQIRKQAKIKKGKICLMLGTYEERKGHEFLFEAFEIIWKKLPDTHLVVFGDSDAADFKRVSEFRASKKSKKNIHLFKYIQDGFKLINQADILLVSSQHSESFGLTIVESMIRKVPVVSTNIGGLSEVLGKNGTAAYKCDPTNHKDYTNKIIKVLNNKLIRDKITKNGYNRVKSKFMVARMAQKYRQLLLND
tara:strand:+ start:6103 stop:7317 length:1215 start_codon:yes stop_codon:yes gene_type:complete